MKRPTNIYTELSIMSTLNENGSMYIDDLNDYIDYLEKKITMFKMKIKPNTTWRKKRSGSHEYTYYCIFLCPDQELKFYNMTDFDEPIETGWINLVGCEYVAKAKCEKIK